MKPVDVDQRYYYDVFGTTMRINRVAGQWLLYRVSEDGKSMRINDVAIPDELREAELMGYLDDIFHEYATEAKDRVVKLR